MELLLALHSDLKEKVYLMELTPAPLARLNARYRQQLVMKITIEPIGREIEDALAEVIMKPQPEGSVAALEVDPVSMM
jgi:primosomal protein N'